MTEQDVSADSGAEAVERDEMAEAEAELAKAEEERAARKKAGRAEGARTLAADLRAINVLEEQLGDSNVATIRVGFTPGLPAAAAVRCPKPAEMKRFRDRVKPGQKDGRNREIEPDHAAAAEELAACCRVYPEDKAVYQAMCVARPGLAVQLGKEAVKLAVGAEESEGKG